MSKRYYLASPPIDQRALLDGPEAHHLLHVMRAEVGTELTLFDGNGGEYPACVTECKRREVQLEVGPRQEVDRELSIDLRVGVAMPKGDRQKWLVEKLTELGAAQLVPLTTERGVAELRGKSLERLQRSVVEASKQSGRNQLMQITPPITWSDWLCEASGSRLVAHPTGTPLSSLRLPELIGSSADSARPQVSLAIGPEGGLTEAEVAEAVAAGWQPVSLGRSILRIETAAVALVAVLGTGRG